MAYNYEYPYTDAHRHNDDWLINKVKELALEWIKTSGEWTETREAFAELKNYIADYFKNLDVSEEINEKLDVMAIDGTLQAVIRPIFDEYQRQIDILSNRMDTFTRLAEGSTTGDAELIDARTAYTGEVYDNLGAHIREVMAMLDAEKLGYKGYINTPTDFYQTFEAGVYNILNSAIPDSVNYPSDVGGVLTAKTKTNYEFPMVYELIDNRGDYYIAYKTSKGWSKWKKYKVEDYNEKHYDSVGALVSIAESYFDVAYNPDDQMVYHSRHGLFAPELTTPMDKDDYYLDDEGYKLDADGERIYINGVPQLGVKAKDVKAIVCSQFEQACIGAISYNNSRYVCRDNKALGWGFVSDGTGVYNYTYPEYTDDEKLFDDEMPPVNDNMTACEQAKYFEAKGMLNTFDVNRVGLKAGDLLFFTDDTSDENIYYRKITHVGICLGADRYRFTMMHSTPKYKRLLDNLYTGVMVASYMYTSKAPAFYVHSPINAEYTSSLVDSLQLKKDGKYGVNVNSIYIGEFNFDDHLQRGFYTLQYEDCGDSPIGYIYVTYETGTEKVIEAVKYNGVKNGNIIQVVFYAEMPISSIQMRVANGKTYKSSWAKLYKGYHA